MVGTAHPTAWQPPWALAGGKAGLKPAANEKKGEQGGLASTS